MRRLLHIIIFIATVSVIVAQSPDAPATPETMTVDSVAAAADSLDGATVADSVPVPARVANPNRKRFLAPVNNAATRTQHHNDAQGDTARMIERRRQRSIQYHDENGNTIMVDTVTGQEWIDSTMLPPPPKMKLPLIYAVEVGVNVWDPLMRVFGQKYGGVDFSAALNLHNRYIPTFEAGFGMAKKTPADMNFTYSSPMAPYFKIGADYNFIYNSDPDYRFVAGVRYGFSAFRFTVEDVTFNDSYWGPPTPESFPTSNVTAGWFELVLGLRVRIVGPISAGWMFRYHSVLHQTKPDTGEAWYIPGYGTNGSAITGSFSIVYNFRFNHRKHNGYGPATDVGSDFDALEPPGPGIAAPENPNP